MKQVLFNNTLVSVLELDKLHRGGNKYYKLKGNITEANNQRYDTLLSFGGAWSNHIHALAHLGFEQGFRTIGVIRGERPEILSPMLVDAENWGMQLEFVTRREYREKANPHFLADLTQKFGRFYLLPEGGTNSLAIEGCREIVFEIDRHQEDFDLICLPVGTGGTIAGIAKALPGNKNVLGFVVLKGAEYLGSIVAALTGDAIKVDSSLNWALNHDYHCGGYARCPEPLKRFILDFEATHQLPLDPVYNGKMLYGLSQMLASGELDPDLKIVAVHTGGLQGRRGFDF
ncbi:MAG TPA: pyridoxal-phosphate dependent enzyme [Gammaproteobacteria bacterium]|nr:pyridoxal-phosphate dependent enzyme [Gammaproteobacteria bacterium]HIL95750.1 pyridoxal-phosphate dependent enzyme [Pseudomonadales bacterium]